MGKKTKLAFDSRTLARIKHRVVVFLYSLPKACHWEATAAWDNSSKEELLPDGMCSMACCHEPWPLVLRHILAAMAWLPGRLWP